MENKQQLDFFKASSKFPQWFDNLLFRCFRIFMTVYFWITYFCLNYNYIKSEYCALAAQYARGKARAEQAYTQFKAHQYSEGGIPKKKSSTQQSDGGIPKKTSSNQRKGEGSDLNSEQPTEGMDLKTGYDFYIILMELKAKSKNPEKFYHFEGATPEYIQRKLYEESVLKKVHDLYLKQTNGNGQQAKKKEGKKKYTVKERLDEIKQKMKATQEKMEREEQQRREREQQQQREREERQRQKEERRNHQEQYYRQRDDPNFEKMVDILFNELREIVRRFKGNILTFDDIRFNFTYLAERRTGKKA
jgi:gas vesicle protein